MKNLSIVLSNVDKSVAFEWIVEGLREQYNISFILIGQKGTYLSKYLSTKKIPVCEISFTKKREIVRAVFQTLRFLKTQKTDVIHTHLVEASLIGLFAARLLSISKRIYTRHHSDYNYKYSPKGIKYDKFCNRFATNIVAISEQVKKILIVKEGVPEKKVTLIHHGFDLDYFSKPDPAKVKALQEKYNPNDRHPVIGVIARQTHWKGIQYIIPAFAEVLKKQPGAFLVLANAIGDYKPEINKLLEKHLPAESYKQVAFEYDMPSLYQLFDVYVHTPIDDVVEAFGQTYVEALAAGIPSVFTLSGIAVDFIEHKKNALVVPYCESPAIADAITTILENDELRLSLIKNGKGSVEEEFALHKFLDKLAVLYG